MILPDTRMAGLFLAGVSAASLAAAYIAQYGFGLEPCILCLYQRVPYAVVVVLGLLLAWMPGKFSRAILVLCGLAFLAGAAIAAFHTGVEQHWWEGTNACGIKSEGQSFEEFRQQILNAPKARCDDIPWSLFGISMAGYNTLMSLGLSALTYGYLRYRR